MLQVRELDDAVKLVELPTSKGHSVESSRKLQSIATAVEGTGGGYKYICVNDCLPIDRKQRYDVACLLRKQGLPFKTCLYQYSTGGSMGYYYFLWKVSDEDSRDVQLTHTARLTAKIKEEMPVYHTRQMKREFKLKFGAVANAKPVYLRKMCQFVLDRTLKGL